ncbi:MAG: hypothetical protein F6J96_22840 [Symploca sp. SIO1C2]|nr:hypothetical protein [Symploca sp. SIO1C2]
MIDNLFNPINNDIRGSKSNIAGKNPNGRSMDTNRLATLSITFGVAWGFVKYGKYECNP